MSSTALQKHSAAAAYAVAMLLVGVPVWWKTTEVYRAPLPYAEIAELEGLEPRQRADIVLLCPADEAHARAPGLQALLMKSDIFDVSLNVKPLYPSERRTVEGASSLAELDSALGPELLRDSPGLLGLLEAPAELFPAGPHLLLGNHRLLYYSVETPSALLAAAVLDTVLQEPALAATLRTERAAPDTAIKRTAGQLDLFLTLLVPQPEHVTASWDIEAATETHLRPFLDAFPLNITVKSQVLYLTPLDIPAVQEGSGPLELRPEQLGLAVNSVETALASQASSAPAINLIVYLPPIERAPMTVRGSSTDSFLIPRWGGVMFYNYLGEGPATFPLALRLDTARVAGVWLGQLRHLLGVQEPELPALALPASGLRAWEVDAQLRRRALQYTLETVSTLTSLSRLLSQIPNIVISDEVAARVAAAVAGVRAGAGLVGRGSLEQGWQAAQQALQLAETAFFDKSLLALLYFPDDQKYAIYIPFFLPVGIPVILSLKTIFKFFRGELKPKSD